MAGLAAMQSENWAQAETAFVQSLACVPDRVSTLVNLAATLLKLNKLDQAAPLLARTLSLDSSNPEALLNEGILFFERRDFGSALKRFDSLLADHPENIDVRINRAAVLGALKREQEGLDELDRIIQLAPGHAPAYLARASLWHRLERWQRALSDADQALRLNPRSARAHLVRGNVFYRLKQLDAALACYEQAIALDGHFAEAHCNRGRVLTELNRWEAAIESYTQALSINQDYGEARLQRGRAFEQTGKPEAASADYAAAIAHDPKCSVAYIEQGNLWRKQKKLDLAIDAYAHAHRLDPAAAFVKGKLLHAKMLACDWSDMQELCRAIDRGVQAGDKVVDPFAYQAIASSEAHLLVCATTFSEHWFPAQDNAVPRGSGKPRIHVGYLCGEFREQATSFLMARVYELHDKGRFKIFAFDNGYDDGSAMRRRLCKAFDEVIDISKLSDEAAADEIRRRDIDILVNLNGYFGLARPNLFAMRVSPVQVNYLGFPGTLGASYMDYLIADETVIPVSSRQHYREKIVYMPHCYQANDALRPIATRPPARSEYGLSQDGFVFCCFNNNYKITPETFDQWMRILSRVPGSVLWVFEGNTAAVRNLRAEAARRGVAAERLVFARDMPLPEHLARHALADLFLDTLPYNAHTTASDCLWAGLPLLTCTGNTFPGRVASSLLKAIGLPELITSTADAYEEKAVWLAQNPAALQALRRKLAGNRDRLPLFNSALSTRHLEQAYRVMRDRHLAGLPPESFSVAM